MHFEHFATFNFKLNPYSGQTTQGGRETIVKEEVLMPGTLSKDEPLAFRQEIKASEGSTIGANRGDLQERGGSGLAVKFEGTPGNKIQYCRQARVKMNPQTQSDCRRIQ